MDDETAPVISPAEAFYNILESERRYQGWAARHDTSPDQSFSPEMESLITPEELSAAEKFYSGDHSVQSLAAAQKLVNERQRHLESLTTKAQTELKIAAQAMEFVKTTKVPA